MTNRERDRARRDRRHPWRLMLRVPAVLAAVLAASLCLGAVAQQRAPRVRVFPPEELARLAPPDRDEWQQPDTIMDKLGIAERDRVADVGAGGGWFTLRLARRVGPNGRVYSEDVQQPMLNAIMAAVGREDLKNVEPILGKADNPQLPTNLRAVVISGVYWYLRPDAVKVLKSIAASLAPKGRLGIIDYKKDGAGGPGPDIGDRIDPEVIVRDANAAGLKLQSHETFLRYQYLLIFERAGGDP